LKNVSAIVTVLRFERTALALAVGPRAGPAQNEDAVEVCDSRAAGDHGDAGTSRL